MQFYQCKCAEGQGQVWCYGLTGNVQVNNCPSMEETYSVVSRPDITNLLTNHRRPLQPSTLIINQTTWVGKSHTVQWATLRFPGNYPAVVAADFGF